MLKKPKILVVGSLMMDLTAITPKAPNEGETVIGTRFVSNPGGKGANQAVQCARLGAEVTMVGQVGDDAFGPRMKGAVADAGVDVTHITVDPNESSGTALITLEVSERGALNRITVCPGSNFTLTVDDIAWLKDDIKNYDMVMMQFEMQMSVIEAVAQWAHDAGVPVMINPAPAAPMSEKLLACSTYVSPNEHEAATLSGHAVDVSNGVNMDDVAKVAEILRGQGVGNLIITLGENGSALVDDEGIHTTPCVKLPPQDTTAAGDSYVASFCTGISAGMTRDQAMAFASHAAGIAVSRLGAIPSLPTIEEVQSLMAERGYTGFDLAELDALK